MDALTHRIYTKALGNELAIAVGSSLSDQTSALPVLARALTDEFHLNLSFGDSDEAYYRWNEVVEAAERNAGRAAVSAFVAQRVANVVPTPLHHAIARIPISNFIDTTFDRSLTKALLAAGRRPLAHDWDRQMVGIWRQRNPDTPNVFYMLPRPDPQNMWLGVRHPSGQHGSIQATNIDDMLDGRDLLLLDFSFAEADSILQLGSLALSGERS